jgi:GT2 family glycosyltransferase
MTSRAAPLVYVITLNWNRRDDTLAFLASFSQLTYPHCRILVVDNGSTDDSVPAITAQFPDVEQIVNGRNPGFAAGANVGIRHALAQGADFVFVANNDTLIAPDALDLLVHAALASEVGLAAPKIYYASDPRRIWSAGAWRDPVTLEVTGCRRGQYERVVTFPKAFSFREGEEEPFEVDFVTACGMLIRRRCFEVVGLFDERFFMYYEDSDYCLRVRSAGYRVLVVPRARMWHKVAISSGGIDSPAERYAMGLSSVLFFRKHVGGARWLIVAPYRTGSAIKTLVRLLAGGRTQSAQAYLRGLWDGVGTGR